MASNRVKRTLSLLLLTLCIVPLASAQQTGSLSGTVTAVDGSALPGVTVEASSNVLPQPRVTVTNEVGDYRLPALIPGTYNVTFSLAGLQTTTRRVQVRLSQENVTNVSLGVAGVSESITVTADSPLTDPTSTAIRSEVSEEMIDQIPVGNDFRDLMKLAPAVVYSEDIIRGPSAGGSGQDNVYFFDGVNITLPLYGTLSAEPSSHDMEQVTVVKGGAKALDFNRAAGFSIDSVSKSGTNEWAGQFEYEIQNAGFTSDQDTVSTAQYDQDLTWANIGIGGPIVRDQLFFYGSYYRPTIDRANSSNVYGDVPDYQSTRNEYFGKLTWTPISNLLLNGSYRDSDRTGENASISGLETPQAGKSEESGLKIAILEGSWVINSRSFASFKINDYQNLTSAIANVRSGASPSLALGTQLDLTSLDQLGYLTVPSLLTNNPSFNQYAQQFIDRYGYVNDAGQRVGGGFVGVAPLDRDQIDFFRESYQAAYDITIGSEITHDIHVGFQQYTDSEELTRTSNGWGQFTVNGGRSNCPAGTECAGTPYFLLASFTRGAQVGSNLIRSEFESNNLEINDTIKWGNWAFNAGLLLSNDTLYGQGLREDSSALSGFVADAGNKYEMYEVPWDKQIQPRLGVTWSYNGRDTLYTSYARFNPAVSSLPRAASWDRNAFNQLYEVFFDASGTAIGSRAVGGSTGKLFVEDLDPRYTDEYLIGTSRQLTDSWSARAYTRYRYSTNFWEDTNNNARVAFEPPSGISRTYYIEDLAAKLAQIGTGGSQNSYVIAELDGAFTKYYEATVESDYRMGNANVTGSYTWSHYYGNFDQDNTSTTNDLSIFVGSSNIADSAGRQIWDRKYGNLRADRRHLLKLYGFYNLPWQASVGAYGLYQSGHAWEAWSYEPYKHLTTSTSDTNRYAEPAGSRTTPAHYQVDLNYTQNIPFGGLNLQLVGDVFNILDNQTGYNPQPSVHSAQFGEFRSFYAPRRFRLGVRLQF